jgi:hypothetical protein
VLHVPGADADANTGDPEKSLEVCDQILPAAVLRLRL